jgi:1-aminocyclopropane-1-carboxylate deaminase
MKCIYIPREDYKKKKIPGGLDYPAGSDKLLVINEGGYGAQGAKGCMEITTRFVNRGYTDICCAVGTGTMLAGLLMGSDQEHLIGFSVMKNNPELSSLINQLLPGRLKDQFTLEHNYHFGGYAKYNKQLITFMNDLYRDSGIPTDFVYTGKLLFGVTDLVQKNYFPPGSKILVIHSGGLQGNNSLASGTLIF